MPTNAASFERPNTRRQSYLLAIEQNACKRGGVHTRPIMDDWYLEIQSETGSIQHILETTIHSSHGEVKNLSAQDFNDLFIAVIPFIKHNNNGQLDGVQLDLGLVT